MRDIVLVRADGVIAYNIALGGVYKLPQFEALKRVIKGTMPWRDMLGLYASIVFNRMNIKTNSDRILLAKPKRIRSLYLEDGKYYRLREVKLPLLNEEFETLLFTGIYEDTFWSYLHCDDKYDEKTFDECDKFLGEGLYGLVNDKVNVTVEPGDIVIDAGSWVGDFAAYASQKLGGGCNCPT